MTPEQFWQKVTKSEGCWDWTGGQTRDGYGRTATPLYSEHRAHRIAYRMLVGPIPKGLTIDHLCRNRRCVNPDHMEPVSRRVNTLRGIGPTAINAVKAVCSKGHPLSGSNLLLQWRDETWRRSCKVCASGYSAKYYRRRMAAIDREEAMSSLRRCHLCGVYAHRGFTRRWINQRTPVWVCAKVRECEARSAALEGKP